MFFGKLTIPTSSIFHQILLENPLHFFKQFSGTEFLLFHFLKIAIKLLDPSIFETVFHGNYIFESARRANKNLKKSSSAWL